LSVPNRIKSWREKERKREMEGGKGSGDLLCLTEEKNEKKKDATLSSLSLVPPPPFPSFPEIPLRF
jgi:hypothetical protein